jgi:hypothetical protein
MDAFQKCSGSFATPPDGLLNSATPPDASFWHTAKVCVPVTTMSGATKSTPRARTPSRKASGSPAAARKSPPLLSRSPAVLAARVVPAKVAAAAAVAAAVKAAAAEPAEVHPPAKKRKKAATQRWVKADLDSTGARASRAWVLCAHERCTQFCCKSWRNSCRAARTNGPP